ncbi:signal peptide peptidase SppA [Tessaracoccus rhinocerotis]|uniref:Signal peptide peptidase SppA n=1 Tax=Tessaracoccus rhinocerotis TaxID=1689449 RepID=A0A553K233_9ACTN|nr:signal peptide peptidase SppA [Tessaracoccus rhinocerotis]TRY18757.1 signal peptide peptidase SppA [Tessaracoccus rhinocerotis]
MRLKDILDKLPALDSKPVVLELDLARGLVEVRPTNPLKALQSLNATTMTAVREHLHAAAKDSRVAGLVVHAVNPGQQISILDEVGQLVETFGESKPTVAWAESFGELDNSLAAYKLATACHEIWLQPTGAVGIGGAELNIVLLKGLLNKVGVEPQFGQRKEYKSAADQFSADEVTDANREMMTRIGQSIVDDAVATIARRRNLDVAAVWDAVNESPLTPEAALAADLVDHLGYRDQAYAACLDAWSAQPEHLRFVSRWSPKPSLAAVRRKHGAKVAVVPLRGAIVTGRGGPGGMGGEQVGSDVVDEHLRAVLRDDAVKAVVFEIDSPGGSAVASDFIRRAVLRVRESGRPVVARMGSVAASGGYYAAMGCTEIVAQPTTLTGSIGVLAGKMVTAGLYDRLGLKRESIRIGARAGMLSSSSEFTEEDWAKLDESLDRIYADFTTFAAEDRGMAHEDLEKLARGRVWTGADAHERGLVDHLGGWRTAWERTCALADLDPDKTPVERIGHLGMLERLLPANSSEARSAAGVVGQPTAEDLLVRAAAWLGLSIPGALSLPFRIDIR